MRKFAILLVLSLTLVAMTQVASAEMIQIQLVGVNLSYNGNDIVNEGGASTPDPLSSATFFVNNVDQGADTTGVTLALNIPDVIEIPVDGGQVDSAVGGSLYLDLGDDKFLELKLASASINYIYVPLASSEIHFVLAGAAAEIVGQDLPYSMGDPVSVSFSTQVTPGTVSVSGEYVTSFNSAGTGEISGIPEPATMCLLALGGLVMLKRRRRGA